MTFLSSDIGRVIYSVLSPDDPEGAWRMTTLPHLGSPAIVPVSRPVSTLRVGLLVSLGARTLEQEPLRPTNDLSYRVIPRSVPGEQITFEHRTPARFWADEDLNVAFPRDRLAELETEGVIGQLAPDAISMLGSIWKWDELATDMAPRILAEFTRQQVDLVLAVPFCPACHQAVAVLCRALEARGMPTLMLSVLRDISEAYQVPRAALMDYPVGSPCGRVGDPEHQRATLRAALCTPLDATVAQLFPVDLPYQEDGGDDWIETLLDAYRTNTAGMQANMRDHEGDHTLVGQEKNFTIRCNC